MQTIRVAHSPDSDDAFMYFGIACGAVRAEGITFEQGLLDIESANQAAQQGVNDVTAISAAAYPYLADRWLLLDSGASMGDGYGPIVIVPEGSPLGALSDLSGKRIAVPGLRTSAALALSLQLILPKQRSLKRRSEKLDTASKVICRDSQVVVHTLFGRCSVEHRP